MTQHNIPAYWADKATAIFVKRGDPSVEMAIMPSVFGPVGYISFFRDGHLSGSMDANRSVLNDDGLFECVKAPVGSLYHAWHICTCDKCSGHGHDAIWGPYKHGGKIWDHSQGAWDEHLRYVPNDDVMTYNTVR